MALQQEQQRVQLSLSLSTTSPHTISINDPDPAEPLKLIASIRQISSPFPDREVTLMTKYSCLDTTPMEDAFIIRAMQSPKLTVQDPQGTTPEIFLWHVGKHITFTRISGDPDLLKRDEADGFTFLTIPPVGQGQANVAFELSPERLLSILGNSDDPIQDTLRRFLRPGDTYGIAPGRLHINWWAFGSLGELKKGKIARWTFPDSLPLFREQGEDETNDVGDNLKDLVDLHQVNHLSSRSAVEDEQKPNVREMRLEGWVFGEPEAGLEMLYDEESKALFTITE